MYIDSYIKSQSAQEIRPFITRAYLLLFYYHVKVYDPLLVFTMSSSGRHLV